jgi:hypothetical protein
MKTHYLTGEIWKSNSGEEIAKTACWVWTRNQRILTTTEKEKTTCVDCLNKMSVRRAYEIV